MILSLIKRANNFNLIWSDVTKLLQHCTNNYDFEALAIWNVWCNAQAAILKLYDFEYMRTKIGDVDDDDHIQIWMTMMVMRLTYYCGQSLQAFKFVTAFLVPCQHRNIHFMACQSFLLKTPKGWAIIFAFR